MSEKRILKPEMRDLVDGLIEGIIETCEDYARVRDNGGFDDYSVFFEKGILNVLSARITEALEELGLSIYETPKIDHELKCWSEFFQPIWDDKKTFEIRKDERNFKVGDRILLREYNPTLKIYSQRSIVAQIIYILHDDNYLSYGYVAFSMKILEKRDDFK